jgi:hypothetical protein
VCVPYSKFKNISLSRTSLAANSSQIQNTERFIMGTERGLKGYFKDAELIRNPDEKTKRLISIMEGINQKL